ncbi:hypothetical protein AMTRI_Chr10g4000 [Amborella trichopoda]|uniref:Uncharacterized protein n=1 Tax=Amborella trichopoda TaxID=13333 RepID=W1NMY1_AMBTC|nr:hypothetical protein AMTR_s00074p00149560 [Amborella trichopoda]
MKKNRGTKVHPTPWRPQNPDPLRALPSAILALALALGPEDQKVLAYLLARSPEPNIEPTKPLGPHPPLFECSCFSCYTIYWARWDSSKDKHLIHDILDEVESLRVKKMAKPKGRERREKKGKGGERVVREEEERERVSSLGLERESDEEDGVESGGGRSLVRRVGEGVVGFVGMNLWGLWNPSV